MTNWRQKKEQRELAEEIADRVAKKITEKVMNAVFMTLECKIRELASAQLQSIQDELAAKGKRFLSVSAAAKLIGCGSYRVLSMCRDGRLPCINVGDTLKPRYKIDPADIERLKYTGIPPLPSKQYGTTRRRRGEVPSRY